MIWVLRVGGFLIGLGIVTFAILYYDYWWDDTPVCTETQKAEGGAIVSRPGPRLQEQKDGNYNIMLNDGTVCKVR